MITYCYLASNIAGLVGGIIGSILILIIVAFVCCITVVAIRKKHNRKNICKTQQFELQTIGSLETTQRMTVTCSSRPLPKCPDATFNSIPQRQSQNSVYVTQPVHYPVANCRPLPPYNESCNNVGPHEPQIAVPNLHLAASQQQQPDLYKHQAGHHPIQQQAVNTQKPNQGRQPNTSAALSSFATFSAHNPIVQSCRQQSSDIGNWENPTDAEITVDNPAYGFLGAAHEESDYENMEDLYDEVK